MSEHDAGIALVSSSAGQAQPHFLADDRKLERLPFTIKVVENEEEMRKAIFIRQAAYARHLPELAKKMAVPDELDYADDVKLLLVESKLDGAPLGTARIQLNTQRELCVEQSVDLPAWMRGQRLCEVTRLGVETGRKGLLVRLALWKACFFYFEEHQVDWAIATGRPPLDQPYLDLGFVDLFPEKGYIPLRHVGNVPHRVMGFESPTAYKRLTVANNPLRNFMFHTDHPDIQLNDVALQQVAAYAEEIAIPTQRFA